MTEPEEHTNPPDSRICHECGTTIAAGVKECPRCALAAELGSKGFEIDLEALGAELPQLEIMEEIGRGGMGVVFKARQTSLGRDVALKVLPKELDYDPGFSERFLRESRTLAGLSHPHVVAVHDAGQAAGHHYLLMEYVDGTDLAQLMKAGDVQPEQALSIVSQICEALQYAHDQGVVHRDIKPGNILLDRAGQVKLGDFGLAKLVQTDDSMRLTGTLQAMGTPHYMAPEQYERPLEVDHRADLYSLGVVLYELLTGELPIGRFPVPSKKADIDVRLDEVVMKTLEKEPELRYQSASEIRVGVDQASSRQAGFAAVGTSAQAGKKGGLSRNGIALLILVAVGVTLFTYMSQVFLFPTQMSQAARGVAALLMILVPASLCWLVVRSRTKELGQRYGCGLVLLVFVGVGALSIPASFILAMGHGFVPGVWEIIPLLLWMLVWVSVALVGWLMMRSAKKEWAVSSGGVPQENRVSTASYLVQDAGGGASDVGPETPPQVDVADQASDIAEKSVPESRAGLDESVDAEPGAEELEEKDGSLYVQAELDPDSSGKAVASMILGIASFLSHLCPCVLGPLGCFVDIISPLLAILGLILGILSLESEKEKKVYAITGIVMSAISLIVTAFKLLDVLV